MPSNKSDTVKGALARGLQEYLLKGFPVAQDVKLVPEPENIEVQAVSELVTQVRVRFRQGSGPRYFTVTFREHL